MSADYIAKTHFCPDCLTKARLVVFWDGKQDAAKCGGCGRRDGFVKRESLTAVWKRDPESLPVEIRNKLESKYGVEAMSEQSLSVISEQQMVQRIEKARWLPQMQPQEKQVLAHLSVTYGLDPLMKEMTLYEGAPYITVAGLVRIAHRQKSFAGIEDRPMTEEERKQYGFKAPVCWIVKVYRSNWSVPAVGTGQADPAAPFRNNPIERTRPEWLARSRAMRQALKLAFPHSLPFEEMENAEEVGIDPETGEILDRPTVVRVMEAEPVEDAELVPDFPSDLAAHDDGDPDEEANKADLRAKVTQLAEVGHITAAQIEKFLKCPIEEASIDSLIDLQDKLRAKVSKSA